MGHKILGNLPLKRPRISGQIALDLSIWPDPGLFDNFFALLVHSLSIIAVLLIMNGYQFFSAKISGVRTAEISSKLENFRLGTKNIIDETKSGFPGEISDPEISWEILPNYHKLLVQFY